jgi:hypothetical protein
MCRTHRTLISAGECVARAAALGLVAAAVLCGSVRTADAALIMNNTTPGRYDLGVPANLAQIWAFFNGPLAPLPQNCVRVSGSMSGLHDGTVTRADNVIIFQNGTEPFFPGELVVVNYRADIQNLGGESLTGGAYFAFTIASAPATANWSDPQIYEASDIPYFIYGGDLDEDDTPDVAAPNEGTDDVSIFRNIGGVGVFTTHQEYGVGDKPSSIFGEDFDNDGDQDLATADINSGTVSVLLNNGDGTFAPRQVYTAGSQCRQIHGADFDGDNDVDLCATAHAADRLHIYTNDGDGTFTPAVPITTISDGPFATRTGDFNADGHADVAVACQNSDVLDVFLNNGAGGLARTGTYTLGNGPWDLHANDMDGDGDCDLVAVASFGNQLVVLFNNGSGAFPNRHTIGTSSFPLAVFAGDVDGDGDLDATSSNYSGGTVGVYLNPGNGNVALQTNLPVSISGSYAWTHDLDGDQDLDLSVVDEEADLLFVFYNGSLPADAAGGLPAALRGDPRLAVMPNPLDPGAGATLRLAGLSGDARIEIVTADGRRMREIWTGRVEQPEVQLWWDGRDARGRALAPGRYWIVARAEDGKAVSPVVLTR